MTDQNPSKDRAERQGRRRTVSGTEHRAETRRRLAAKDVVGLARAYIDDLLDRPVEGISGLRRSEDGWEVRVDVVEMERVPDTTSLLATYELNLDSSGELAGWRRVARYRRSDTGS
ncbi:MAG TPA: gas vesicle protein GvpO [Yinghuangia sp.]|uniref:gas vesicle protein GvpO n=1 Tax=Yinghuangia sp. YIM S10712 TaxID=3436930 RepID=UPI002CEEC897|nr:gas vesicle protein GvpO [Yinghuangia sp.]